MASMNVKTGIVFLIQMVIGAMGNIFLLSQYLCFYFNSGKSRSTNVILRHLTVANTLAMLSRGIPETMAAFGMEVFLSDAGCKPVFYAHRVGRGASMGSTCLLSVFQAISISPEDWKWKELKVKALKHMSPAAVLCWVPPLMLNIIIPVNVTANQKNKTVTHKRDLGYCFSREHEKVSNSVTAAVLAISDALCMGQWLHGLHSVYT
ncbi:Vomeronasal type-1 receptor 2 [Fukomys damarensis]|uniref:Vomeronasal type-1 receptor n=1 Tax=Fukomys damarensis TaxID=885580 RepID=A0A091E1R8_FUKDA|nr:Vomeronasal type-1 receptor 2 [Fukomys damarensis]